MKRREKKGRKAGEPGSIFGEHMHFVARTPLPNLAGDASSSSTIE